MQVSYGQVTTCPAPQDGTTPCNCPAGFTACSAPQSGNTIYGGCAPSAVTKYLAVSSENNVGYCFYCEDGKNSLIINTGSGPQDFVTCSNGVTYYPALPGESPVPVQTPVRAPVPAPSLRPTSKPVTYPSIFDAPGGFEFPPSAYTYRSNYSSSSSTTTTSSCFAGSETLLLENGETVAMKDVQIDDKVLVASLDGKSTFYSPVMVLPHTANSLHRKSIFRAERFYESIFCEDVHKYMRFYDKIILLIRYVYTYVFTKTIS